MAGKTQSTTLAKRYTDALFTLSVEKHVVDKIAEELTALSAVLGTSSEFKRLSESPLFSAEQLVQVVAAIVKKANASDITTNLLKLLAENRRLCLVQEIAQQFAVKAKEARGEITAVVTSQRALTEKEKTAISEKLGKKLSAKVAIDEKIDTSILGGLVIQVGSQMMDSSVRGRLERLNIHLKQNVA